MTDAPDGPGWHVYVVRRRDGALYTGIATDVERRLAEHRAGGARAARSLRGRGPLELVLARSVGRRACALRVERSIKALSKARKEALVAGTLALEEVIPALAETA